MLLSYMMNFSIPDDLRQYLADIDRFIEEKIIPLQNKDDNNRFFDHRREHARTDWDNGGLPRKEWEELLAESRRLADEAGFYRFSLPKQYGGESKADGRGSNLWMAVIREHLAAKGLGLFNDLQTEHSVVGNFPDIVMLMNFGNEQQKEEFIPLRLQGKFRMTFGLTEPGHGSDATHMATKGRPETRNGVRGWVLNGYKKWQTGMHHATHCSIFARTSGRDGEVKGISCFIVPADTPGLKAESYEWCVCWVAVMRQYANRESQDFEHAYRPCDCLDKGCLGSRIRSVRTHTQRIGSCSSFCPRKPHPASCFIARRRCILCSTVCRIR